MLAQKIQIRVLGAALHEEGFLKISVERIPNKWAGGPPASLSDGFMAHIPQRHRLRHYLFGMSAQQQKIKRNLISSCFLERIGLSTVAKNLSTEDEINQLPQFDYSQNIVTPFHTIIRGRKFTHHSDVNINFRKYYLKPSKPSLWKSEVPSKRRFAPIEKKRYYQLKQSVPRYVNLRGSSCSPLYKHPFS